jgi:hypothetical protein
MFEVFLRGLIKNIPSKLWTWIISKPFHPFINFLKKRRVMRISLWETSLKLGLHLRVVFGVELV